MSKTHKFRITVTTGDRKYAPGEAVPVGGKNGISADEIKSIEGVHGVWTGEDTPGLPAASASNVELEAARKALSDAQGEIDALKAVIAAHDKVDAAAAAVSAEDAPDSALEDLSTAEAELEAARKDAGLGKS